MGSPTPTAVGATFRVDTVVQQDDVAPGFGAPAPLTERRRCRQSCAGCLGSASQGEPGDDRSAGTGGDCNNFAVHASHQGESTVAFTSSNPAAVWNYPQRQPLAQLFSPGRQPGKTALCQALAQLCHSPKGSSTTASSLPAISSRTSYKASPQGQGGQGARHHRLQDSRQHWEGCRGRDIH